MASLQEPLAPALFTDMVRTIIIITLLHQLQLLSCLLCCRRLLSLLVRGALVAEMALRALMARCGLAMMHTFKDTHMQLQLLQEVRWLLCRRRSQVQALPQV